MTFTEGYNLFSGGTIPDAPFGRGAPPFQPRVDDYADYGDSKSIQVGDIVTVVADGRTLRCRAAEVRPWDDARGVEYLTLLLVPLAGDATP